MYVDPDWSTGLLTPPKTRSRSTRDALVARGWKVRDTHHGIDPVTCRRVQRVGVLVRNHWAVMAAYYQDVKATGRNVPPFGEWLRASLAKQPIPQEPPGIPWSIQWKRASVGYLWTRWMVWANTVIRVERYDEELTAFLGFRLDTGHVGKAKYSRVPYREMYDVETRDLLGKYFADEIAACGYTFDGLC